MRLYKFIRPTFSQPLPKGQKEKKSVTFAIRLRTIWYDREGVKFRDSGSEIERNIAKRQICHTLPERT
jgi:hypothetical protein